MKSSIALVFIVWVIMLSGFALMCFLCLLAYILKEPRLAIGYWQSVLVSLISIFILGALAGGKH